MMNENVLKSSLLSFSDKTVKHHTHSKEDILHDVGIDFCFLRFTVDDSIEARDVFSDKFSLENSGDFCNSFDLCNMVFVNLSSDSFEEFFLFPTFVFNFVFYYFSKLSAVLWVS